MRVYGSKVSYYTGKLEAYLRFKGFEYERIPSIRHQRAIRRQVGAVQMPVVELDDGRWLSDSTPTLAFLETVRPEPAVYPADPVQRFIALLVEDHADEWLWRPAMHYRWSYAHDRELLSSILTDELTGHIPLPRWLKRRLIQRRQQRGFVSGDGVSAATRDHVEGSYRNALASLDPVFAVRPFLLGETPTIADFGLMGPMLRHFGQDPTPADLMRDSAPNVAAWVMRVWSATPQNTRPVLVKCVPDDLAPLLGDITSTHLVQLRENARAFARGARRFSQTVQGCTYTNLPISRYRVWCLEVLRHEFRALPADAQAAVRSLLGGDGGDAAVLWQEQELARSDYDPEGQAPFNRAINVYASGVPR
jgi:glutathione S-transferase